MPPAELLQGAIDALVAELDDAREVFQGELAEDDLAHGDTLPAVRGALAEVWDPAEARRASRRMWSCGLQALSIGRTGVTGKFVGENAAPHFHP